MKPAHITAHAIERFAQRIEDLPETAIIEAMDTSIVRTAIEIGASAVILPSGHRYVIADGKIVTVTPKPIRKRCKRGRD